MPRPNGISVLVACQNSAKTVGLCLRSFLPFADEMIIVDNGSTDGTRAILEQFAIEHRLDPVWYYDCPDLPDLHHNRQFALEHSRYRYVMRCDSDFVAYDRITELRQRLLAHPRGLMPWAFPHASLVLNWATTGTELCDRPPGAGRHVAPPITKSRLCIYEVFPGFRFQRVGTHEGARFSWLMRWFHHRVREPYWMHCNIKTALGYLRRSQIPNWRKLGKFDKFPTVDSYLWALIPYPQSYHRVHDKRLATRQNAAESYVEDYIKPHTQPYDPQRWYPYPEIMQKLDRV